MQKVDGNRSEPAAVNDTTLSVANNFQAQIKQKEMLPFTFNVDLDKAGRTALHQVESRGK
jgi:hypothetical protein